MAKFKCLFNLLFVSGVWGMGQSVNQQLVNVNTKRQLNNQTRDDFKKDFKKKKLDKGNRIGE